MIGFAQIENFQIFLTAKLSGIQVKLSKYHGLNSTPESETDAVNILLDSYVGGDITGAFIICGLFFHKW